MLALDTSSFHHIFIVPPSLQIDESEVGQVAEKASCNTLYTLIYLN